MRHKIMRLMMFNTLGFFKNSFEKKNFKIFSQSSQKKIFFLEISKIFELDMLYTIFRGVEHDAIG